MRFELTTLTLARLCSTPELRPHPVQLALRGGIIVILNANASVFLKKVHFIFPRGGDQRIRLS
jgi:hypothetical protein